LQARPFFLPSIRSDFPTQDNTLPDGWQADQGNSAGGELDAVELAYNVRGASDGTQQLLLKLVLMEGDVIVHVMFANDVVRMIQVPLDGLVLEGAAYDDADR
jgi:hypothetical protein